MTAKQLRDLFFQTGLPEAYVLAQRRARQEIDIIFENRVYKPPGKRGDQT